MIAIVLILSLVIAGGWLCVQQANIFAHPPRFPVASHPSDYKFANGRDVTLITSDAVKLSGWFIPPPQPAAKNPTILFVHGIGGNRLNSMLVAQWLNQQGYALLMFDLRNQGSSGGTFSTMGLREVEDVKAAFATLIVQPDVDPDRIIIFGQSMGGSTAIMAMAQLPQARALIVETAYTSVIDVTNDGVQAVIGRPFIFGDVILGMTNLLTGDNIYAVRPIDVIASIAPRPILIMHGTSDTTIPVSHAVALYEKAQSPKSLWLVEGGVHGNLYQIAQGEYQQHVLDFLNNIPDNQ